MTYIYGIVTRTGEHIDVSTTERGAKCYATRRGYIEVSRRNTNHYYVVVIAINYTGKWVDGNGELTLEEVHVSNVERGYANLAGVAP